MEFSPDRSLIMKSEAEHESVSRQDKEDALNYLREVGIMSEVGQEILAKLLGFPGKDNKMEFTPQEIEKMKYYAAEYRNEPDAERREVSNTMLDTYDPLLPFEPTKINPKVVTKKDPSLLELGPEMELFDDNSEASSKPVEKLNPAPQARKAVKVPPPTPEIIFTGATDPKLAKKLPVHSANRAAGQTVSVKKARAESNVFLDTQLQNLTYEQKVLMLKDFDNRFGKDTDQYRKKLIEIESEGGGQTDQKAA